MKFSSLITLILIMFVVSAIPTVANAQQRKKPTKQEILRMSLDELLELPLAEILELTEIMGVSSMDELINLIITTASKQEERLFDSPLATSVLTRYDIQKSGASTLMEAMRLVPGVIVREQTPGNYDIHLRGFDAINPNGIAFQTPSSITLVMINNRVVYNDWQGETFWEYIHLGVDEIEQIEVVRGPSAAMYGPNAAAGVIHIITTNPNDRAEGWKASGVAQGGMYRYQQASGGIEYKSEGNWAFRVSGSYDYRDRHNVDYWRYSTIGGFFSSPNPGGFQSLPSNSDVMYLGLFIQDQFNYPQNQANMDDRYPFINLATERYGIQSHLSFRNDDHDINVYAGVAGARQQRIHSENFVYPVSTDSLANNFIHLDGRFRENLSYSFDYSFSQHFAYGDKFFDVDADFFNGDIEYRHRFSDDFSVSGGTSYRWVRQNALLYGSQILNAETGTTSPGRGPVSNNTISAYTKADYKMDKFRFIGALRGDYFEHPGELFFSPMVVGTWAPNSSMLLRASYSRAARSPFLTNLFQSGELRFFMEREATSDNPFELLEGVARSQTDGSHNLLVINDIDLGFRWLIGSNLSLDIETYRMTMDNIDELSLDRTDIAINLIDRTIFAEQQFSYKPTQMNAIMYGSTIAVAWHPSEIFSIKPNITLQQTNVFNFQAIDKLQGTRAQRTDFVHKATPTFFGGIEVNYEPISRLNVHVLSYFYGKQTLRLWLDSIDIESNMLTNITATYKLEKGIDLFATARNVTGSGKRQFGFADQINTVMLAGIRLNY